MWDILGIERTSDQRKIKRSYARLVAKHHPEDNPEKFQEIQQAYERALRYARLCKKQEEEEKQPQSAQIHIESKKKEKQQKQLIEIEQEKTSQDNSIDFETYRWDCEETQEDVIRRLLHQVEYLLYSDCSNQIEEWEKIFSLNEFKKYQLEEKFYRPFYRMIGQCKYDKKVAEYIIRNIDILGIQKKYGYDEKKYFKSHVRWYADRYEMEGRWSKSNTKPKKQVFVVDHYQERLNGRENIRRRIVLMIAIILIGFVVIILWTCIFLKPYV